jgi:hypothetical protein
MMPIIDNNENSTKNEYGKFKAIIICMLLTA